METAKRQDRASDRANKLRVEGLVCSSNEILPDQDENILHILLAESQKEIDSLDTEISRIQDLLNTHRARRDAAMERMTRLRTGIAPHKKLPPEILARIFVESVDEERVCVPLQGLPFPWVLAQVCSKWRTISRAEPLLWSRLYIPSLHTFRRKKSVIPLIQDILSNHGGMGRVELKVGPLINGEWNEMLGLLQRYSSRIWKLNVRLDDSGSHIPSLSEPFEGFDELESLLLFLSDNDSLILGRQSVYAFSNARKLFEVNLVAAEGLPSDVNLNIGMLPWTQLTCLALTNIPSALVLTILPHCHSLLKLNLLLPISKGNTPTSVSSLKTLEYLNVIGSTSSHFSELLAGLITPSLTHFALAYQHYPITPLCLDGPFATNLISFIERTSRNLIWIATHAVSIQPEDMLTLMRLTPMLTNWDFLTQSQITEAVLSTILEEGLVPHLHTVRGWRISSIYSALHFWNNRWHETSPGNYEGIRDSTFDIPMSPSDRTYLTDIMPQLQTPGRKLHINML